MLAGFPFYLAVALPFTFAFRYLQERFESYFTFKHLIIPIMAEPVGIVFASTITQSSPTTTSASQTQSTTSTGTSTHTVQVGGRQDPHHYSPHTIEAAIGDTILFQFLSNNHSVVQADYLVPCVPSAQKGYFNSGNIKVNLNNDGTVDGTVSLGLSPCLFFRG